MYHLAILLHVLLLTYWLGADLGVFYASRFVLRPDLSVQTRAVVLKIMGALDMSPRACLVLFLPSGITLMAESPYDTSLFGGWKLAAAWLLSLGWLALVIADYRMAESRVSALIKRADLTIRYVLVAGLLAVSIYTVTAAEPFGVTTNPKWLGLKVGCYALAMACGIAIRLSLRPFPPAFALLLSSGSTLDVESALRSSLRRSIPFVLAIWALVVTAAALGVFKPGAHLGG